MKMKMLQRSHSTEEEKSFLRSLWRAGKLDVLRKYRDTMPVRKRWENIDPHKIKAYIELLIKKMEDSSD